MLNVDEDRATRITRQLAELRQDENARAWGGLKREAELTIDEQDARRSAVNPARLRIVWARR